MRAASHPPPAEPPRLIGYFTSWGAARNGYTASMIPGDKLTAVNYAFSNVSAEGTCVLGFPDADVEKFYASRDSVDHQADVEEGLHGNFNQLLKLKHKSPHLKTLISIRGWSWSEQFSNAALTEAARQKFVQSCIELYFQKYTGVFNGVDIDWEYPVGGGLKPGRLADKRNFTLLLAEFRKQLDTLGKPDGEHALLTMAAPASPGAYANIELEQIHPYLDWLNLMKYDFHGAWDKVTNFNAPLYKISGDPAADPIVRESLNLDAAVQAYLKAGIPSQKLIVGVPFYGRGWQGVSSQNHGLYQAAAAPAQDTLETGVYDYTDIVKNYLPTYTRSWQAEAKVPWLYNPATGVMITYEDPESVSLKADYVKEHSLGGVMFWELSNDSGELLKTIYDRLVR